MGVGLGVGLGVDLGLDWCVDLGMGVGVDLGLDWYVDLGMGVGLDLGLDWCVDLGMGVGLDLDVGLNSSNKLYSFSSTLSLFNPNISKPEPDPLFELTIFAKVELLLSPPDECIRFFFVLFRYFLIIFSTLLARRFSDLILVFCIFCNANNAPLVFFLCVLFCVFILVFCILTHVRNNSSIWAFSYAVGLFMCEIIYVL